MISRFITIEQPGEWNEFVRRCDTHDVYHLAEYQQAPTPMDSGLPTLAVVEDVASGFAAALPLRIRQISTIPEIFDNDGFDEKLLDAISPYGYPGLIVKTGEGVDAEQFSEELDKLFHRHHIVSAFVRQHPLIDTSGWFGHPFRVENAGLTIAIDLTQDEDDYKRQTRQTHRSEIHSWTERGATMQELDRFDLPTFAGAYADTMKRKGASDKYLFDEAYFRGLDRHLKRRCRLFSARRAETPEEMSDVMAVVLVNRTRAHYHLAATTDDEAASGLSRWLLDSIRRQLKVEGYHTLHLGGGVGASGDSLYRFKSGFSKWRPDFKVVKWIGDADVYARLCEATGAPIESSFFPAYR